jgi:hypothetical protein
MGQLSMLVLQPRTGLAMAVLTNQSPGGLRVIEAALVAAGLRGPAPEEVRDAPVADYAGVYETAMGRATITPTRDRIRIDIEPFGGFPTRESPPPPAPPPLDAFFYTPDRWIVAGGSLDGVRGHFLRSDAGELTWLRVGGRLYRRVSLPA